MNNAEIKILHDNGTCQPLLHTHNFDKNIRHNVQCSMHSGCIIPLLNQGDKSQKRISLDFN